MSKELTAMIEKLRLQRVVTKPKKQRKVSKKNHMKKKSYDEQHQEAIRHYQAIKRKVDEWQQKLESAKIRVVECGVCMVHEEDHLDNLKQNGKRLIRMEGKKK